MEILDRSEKRENCENEQRKGGNFTACKQKGGEEEKEEEIADRI